jgi:hypothetical protein
MSDLFGLYKEDPKAAAMSKSSDKFGLDQDDLWKSKSLEKAGSKFAEEAYGFDRYSNDKLDGKTYRAAEPSYRPDDKDGYYPRQPSVYDHRSYFDRRDRNYPINRYYENNSPIYQNYDNSSPADGAPPTSFGGNAESGKSAGGRGQTLDSASSAAPPLLLPI